MSEILRMPYLVDPHVHFRTPGQEYKEDFDSGSRAALAGGVTTVLDMPNNVELITSPALLERKMELARVNTRCDIGFYLGTMGDPKQNFSECEPNVFGLKVYMSDTTGGYTVSDLDLLDGIFKRWDFDKPILVHAEGNTLHSAVELAEKYDRKLHVCHVSLRDELLQIKRAKDKRPEMVTAEVTPHHLFKSNLWSPHPFNQMKPPLSNFSDMAFLWMGLRDGLVDIVATDHAPHSLPEKLSDNPPSGVTGLETMLPLLLMAERAGEISLNRIEQVTHHNPIKIFGLEEQPDSYIEVMRGVNWQIEGSQLQTKWQLTPFEGEYVMDAVNTVFLRGQIVYSEQIMAPLGSGRVLP